MGLLCDGPDRGHESEAAGREDPPLGVREAGEVGAGEVVEGVLDLLHAREDLGGGLSEWGGALVRGLGLRGVWIAHERLARGGVRGDAVGGEECLGLARGEGVAGDRLGEAHLLLLPEGDQREGRGEGEPPGVQTGGDLGCQAPGEGEAAQHPGLLPPQELCGGGRRQPVVGGERVSDAGLVHGARGLLGGVGLEDPGLGQGARDRLDDDGDLAGPFREPSCQALEAVEDLVGVLPHGEDA